MFEVLLDLRRRYWNESNHKYDRSRGELGFLNELINALAERIMASLRVRLPTGEKNKASSS